MARKIILESENGFGWSIAPDGISSARHQIAFSTGSGFGWDVDEDIDGASPGFTIPIDPSAWTFAENPDPASSRYALWTADIPEQPGKRVVASRGISTVFDPAQVLVMTWEPAAGSENGGRYVGRGLSLMPLGGRQYAALGISDPDGSNFQWITADEKSIIVSNVPAAPSLQVLRQSDGSASGALSGDGRGRPILSSKYSINGGALVSSSDANTFLISAAAAPDEAFTVRALHRNINGDGPLSAPVTVPAEVVAQGFVFSRNEVGGLVEISSLPPQPNTIVASDLGYDRVTITAGTALGPLYAGAVLIPAADVVNPLAPNGVYPRAVRLGANSLPISGTLTVGLTYLAYRHGDLVTIKLPSPILFSDDFNRNGVLAGSVTTGTNNKGHTWGPDLAEGIFKTKSGTGATGGLYIDAINTRFQNEVLDFTIPPSDFYVESRFMRATEASHSLGCMLVDRADPANFLTVYRNGASVYASRKIGAATSEILMEATIANSNGDFALFRVEKTATGLRMLRNGVEVDTWTNTGQIIDPAKLRVWSGAASTTQNSNSGHRIQRLTLGAL